MPPSLPAAHPLDDVFTSRLQALGRTTAIILNPGNTLDDWRYTHLLLDRQPMSKVCVSLSRHLLRP